MTYKKYKKGFTLIETLLAVLILAIALAAPLTIAAKALSAALIAKDQTTAFFLAQDAVEYLRFKRDTSTLTSTPIAPVSWLAGFDSECSGADGCKVDSVKNTVTACSGACEVLQFNETKSWYTYDTSVSGEVIKPSIFTRKVVLGSVASNSDERSITVTVNWKDVGGVTRSLVVREHITNWQ
jgi:prepilin-type N-terminal cleavage/methylation domain-containing protein